MKARWGQNIRAVPIGEMIVSGAPEDVLVGYGLGSCVAVCLYDPVVRVGGLLHALLPAPARTNNAGRATKFVDQGVPLLLRAMERRGALRTRMRAYVCGGARMISDPNVVDLLNIGERNAAAAKAALAKARLRIYGEATGGNRGCTVRLYVATGEVTIKTLRHDEKLLSAVS